MHIEFNDNELLLADLKCKDEDLVALFVNMVAASMILEHMDDTEEGIKATETEAFIEGSLQALFDEMADIYKLDQRLRFSQKRYVRSMLEKLDGSPDEDLWNVFAPYCEFLCAIEKSRELPKLEKLFRGRKWLEWTSLQLARNDLMYVAEYVIESVEVTLERDGCIDLDVAQGMDLVSSAFAIPLPRKLSERVLFMLCDSPSDYQEEKWDDKGVATSYLQ